jgi:hypothetical protein
LIPLEKRVWGTYNCPEGFRWMPCFYCGKRVSLVRQMTDADFCSDEHRRRYHDLTRLALGRLLDHGPQRTTPGVRPAGESVPPVPPPASPAVSARPRAEAPKPHPKPRRAAEPVFLMPPVADEAPPVVAEQEPPPLAGPKSWDQPEPAPLAAGTFAASSGAWVLPDPLLPPASAARCRVAELGSRSFATSVGPAPDRRFPQRFVTGFLAFRSSVEVGIETTLPGGRCGLASQSATAARPAAQARPARAFLVEAVEFAGEIALPQVSFAPVAVAESRGVEAGEAAPPVVLEPRLVAPAPARSEAAPSCAIAVETVIPESPALAAVSWALAVAEPQLAAYPAGWKCADEPRVEQAVWVERDAEIPGLETARRGSTIEARGTWIVPPPAAVVHAAAAREATAPFGGAELEFPRGSACAASRGVLPPAAPDSAALRAVPVAGAGHPALAEVEFGAAEGRLAYPVLPGLPPLELGEETHEALPADTRKPAPAARIDLGTSDTGASLPGWQTAAWTLAGGRTSLAASLPALTAAIPLPGVPVRGTPSVQPYSWQAPYTFAPPELHARPAGSVIVNASLGASRGMELPLRPAAGKVPEPQPLDAPFARHEALLPEIAVAEAPVVRPAAGRHLEDLPFETTALPAARESGPAARARLVPFPVELTSAIGRGAGRVSVRGPAALAGAGAEPLRGSGPRRLEPVLSEAAGPEFAGHRPERPALQSIRPAAGLEQAPPLPAPAGPVVLVPRPQTAAVALAVIEEPELPAAQELAGERSLGSAALTGFSHRALAAPAAPAAAGWRAFTDAQPGYGSIEPRIAGVYWPASPQADFVPEPSGAASAGPAAVADPHTVPGFAAQEILWPELPGQGRLLGHAPAAPLALPGVHDDTRTMHRKSRLAAFFRTRNRPSRLPVFHAAAEKAHMPAGVFCPVEYEDRNDERTQALASGSDWILPEQRWPDVGLAPRSRGTLDPAGFVDAQGGGAAGDTAPIGGSGELPFPAGVSFGDEGIPLYGVDFEAILEAYEPRWRSALKTASGLFRGVLMAIPGMILLSGLLTGCSTGRGSLHTSIQSRAAIHLEHDFSQGLDGWYGGRDWAKNWVRDSQSGFIRAGQLALYRPSQQFTDYRMEFLGQIDGTSMGWVYRAADLQNYYVTRLVVTKPGPLPAMALVRYQVIGGEETQHVQVPVTKVLHNSRPYRIQQEAKGSGFTTSIDNEVVDFWTDDRLRTGGVGFLGGKGDAPHLYWVKVTYQDDFLGKLCATIAPNN